MPWIPERICMWYAKELENDQEVCSNETKLPKKISLEITAMIQTSSF